MHSTSQIHEPSISAMHLKATCKEFVEPVPKSSAEFVLSAENEANK